MKVGDKLPTLGDLVWCQNGIRKNMGIVTSWDPDIGSHREPRDEDYCWVTLLEGNSPGQPKWTKLKKLVLVREDESR